VSKSRYPPITYDADGNGLCRGCQGPIPKNRQTWCSAKCYKKYEPRSVRIFVYKRDEHKCQLCQVDIEWLIAEWWRELREWKKSDDPNKPRSFRDKPRAEFDHIIPYSEEGLTVAENMRTLCQGCHKKRTKEWHKARNNPAKRDARAETARPSNLEYQTAREL